ncbi:hypothetical protein SFUMM280S_03494 [Streptomyces fumanus]
MVSRPERTGPGGRPSPLLKFRTRRPADAHESATRWSVAGESPGGLVLPVPAPHTRRTSCSSCGPSSGADMGLVGPRPERPYFVAQFSQAHPGYAARHRMPAGITGLAQIHGLRGTPPSRTGPASTTPTSTPGRSGRTCASCRARGARRRPTGGRVATPRLPRLVPAFAAVAALTALTAAYLVRVLAPGLPDRALAVDCTRLTATCVLSFGLAGYASAALRAHRPLPRAGRGLRGVQRRHHHHDVPVRRGLGGARGGPRGRGAAV